MLAATQARDQQGGMGGVGSVACKRLSGRRSMLTDCPRRAQTCRPAFPAVTDISGREQGAWAPEGTIN